MRTAAIQIRNYFTVPPYPNAATRSQLLGKALNVALITASGIGIAAMLLLFFAIA